MICVHVNISVSLYIYIYIYFFTPCSSLLTQQNYTKKVAEGVSLPIHETESSVKAAEIGGGKALQGEMALDSASLPKKNVLDGRE